MTVQSTVQDPTGAQTPDQGSQDQSTGQMAQEKVTVAGKEYSSLAELGKDYESLHKEFHKRNQPKAQATEDSQEIAEAKKALKDLGVVTRDDLEAMERSRTDDMRLDTILFRNPDLLERKQEIKELMNLESNQGLAIEDVIAKYNLKPSNKLVRAKTGGDFTGNPPSLDKPANKFADLSAEEKGKWLDNLGRPGFQIAR